MASGKGMMHLVVVETVEGGLQIGELSGCWKERSTEQAPSGGKHTI